MKTVYLDKKERLHAWLTPRNKLMLGGALALLLVLPVWRDTVEGRFLLEPVNRAVLRAAVPGAVVAVSANEGEKVAAGATLLRLRNLALESDASKALADSRAATARATEAQLRYASFGTANLERQQRAERSRLLQEQVAMLTIVSPLNGRVMTPRVADLLGSRVNAGAELVEVADVSTLRARIYLPEFAVRKIHVVPGEKPQAASLLLDSSASSMPGVVRSLAPASSEIEGGLIESTRFRGVRPPPFYVVSIEVANPNGELKAGMAGTALIYTGYRSFAGMGFEAVWDFLGRKLW